MTNVKTAYPLTWPVEWKRTPKHLRQNSRYKVREETAKQDLLHSLKLLGAKHIILSSNVALRQDGLPYSNRRAPEDVGVAVYWQRKGNDEVLACDAWKSMRENIRDIGSSIDSLRQLDRSGSSDLLDRAFAGFAALPAHTIADPPWRHVLEISKDELVDIQRIKAAFRVAALFKHPDRKGGSKEAFQQLCRARDAAFIELGQ